MKQFVLTMAVIGLAATGCAQNSVFGPQARRGAVNSEAARLHAGMRPGGHMARRQAASSAMASRAEQRRQVELAAFDGGGYDDGCYGGDCTADNCGGGGCDSGCDSGYCASGCDGGCCGGCATGCNGGYCDSGCSGDARCGAGSGNGRNGRNGGCSNCGGRGCGLCQRLSGLNPHAGGYPEAQNFNPSPATGQVAYPYYTVRGPRDFLRNNPPSIGPY
jgi:hypothetical protein